MHFLGSPAVTAGQGDFPKASAELTFASFFHWSCRVVSGMYCITKFFKDASMLNW